MKENKVQTRFERMVELNEEIQELKSFLRTNNHLLDIPKFTHNFNGRSKVFKFFANGICKRKTNRTSKRIQRIK